MRYLAALVMLIGIGGAPSVGIAHNGCSIERYNRADASLRRAAGGWRSLMKHQNAFVSCDDGALAEGYSEAVVTLLAHRWDQFSVFVTLANQHPAFRRWALRHIDASASDDDLKKVLRNAASCEDKANAGRLCGEIGRAATAAMAN